MTYDASDRKSIRRAEKAASIADRTRGEVLVQIMSTTAGREWVWHRLAQGNVFQSTYNDQPQRMAFEEGKRSAGLSLLDDIMQWCPEQFIEAMREANGRRTESELKSNIGRPSTGERPIDEELGRHDQGPSGESDAFGGNGED